MATAFYSGIVATRTGLGTSTWQSPVMPVGMHTSDAVIIGICGRGTMTVPQVQAGLPPFDGVTPTQWYTANLVFTNPASGGLAFAVQTHRLSFDNSLIGTTLSQVMTGLQEWHTYVYYLRAAFPGIPGDPSYSPGAHTYWFQGSQQFNYTTANANRVIPGNLCSYVTTGFNSGQSPPSTGWGSAIMALDNGSGWQSPATSPFPQTQVIASLTTTNLSSIIAYQPYATKPLSNDQFAINGLVAINGKACNATDSFAGGGTDDDIFWEVDTVGFPTS